MFVYIARIPQSYLSQHGGLHLQRLNQRSRLGTLIDPVADKTLMICLAASMGYVGLVHAPVAALIIGKDVLMGLGFFALAWKHGYRCEQQERN